MALSLNMEKLGVLMTGWDKKGGQAAEYSQSGSNYRTYRPATAPTGEGGLFIHTKIGHTRGGAQDDHAQVELTLDGNGRV